MSNEPITERHSSRSTSVKQGTATQSRQYTCRGHADESAVVSAVVAFAPTAVSVSGLGMTIDDIDVKTVVAYEATTDSLYEVTVNYTTPDLQDKRPPVEPSDPELVSGDFAARTTYVQLAKKQLNAYFHTMKPPKTKKARHSSVNNGAKYDQKLERTQGWYTSESGIGDASGRQAYPEWEGNQIGKDSRNHLPMGCEKNIAASTFTVTKVIAAATVTNAWLYARMSQVWTMNNATFRGLAARTTMMTGMQSSQRASGDWDITYNFEFRPYVQMSLPSPTLRIDQMFEQGFDSAGGVGSATYDQGFYNPTMSGTTRGGGWINNYKIEEDAAYEPKFFPADLSDIIVEPASPTQEYFEFSAWDYFYLKTREVQTQVTIGDFGDGIDAGASRAGKNADADLTEEDKTSLTSTGFSISRIYDETDFSNLGIGT
jgi:hypothetical protein